MKKIIFTVTAILFLASFSVFGMYGYDGDDWISFLTDGNQFRARMDQLGFVLGNDTIKGTFGFRADTGYMGSILGTGTIGSESLALNPTVSAGIGYTSDVFSIGVGYNFTYIDKYLQIHTPVLMINALDNNLKLAVPIEIAITDNAQSLGPNGESASINNKIKFTGIGFNNIELRYSTGIDAFNEIRFYASYRSTSHESSFNGSAIKYVSEALDLQLRLYFLNTTVGNVGINPFIKVQYSTALKGSRLGDFLMTESYKYPQGSAVSGEHDGNYGIDANTKQSDNFSANPYKVTIAPTLALSASSDIVSLYFEPSLGYTIYGDAPLKRYNRKQTITHSLYWGAYAEMYVTPVQDLEWYFEMDVNGNVTGKDNAKANVNLAPVYFETTTGITWYLPSFGNN